MTVVVIPAFMENGDVHVNVCDYSKGANSPPFRAITLSFATSDIKSRTQQHELIDRVSAVALAHYLELRDA